MAFVGVVRTTIIPLTESILTNNWYIDSGATHHLTYHGEWFVNYSSLYPREFVYLEDNIVQDLIFQNSQLSFISITESCRIIEH